MALVLLLPAHGAMACQLVCMATNQAYAGDLGGLAGADAICDAEFKGFKFARSRSVIGNLYSVYGMNNVWTHGPAAASCQNWTSNSVFQFGTSTANPPSFTDACANSRPLLCCNLNM